MNLQRVEVSVPKYFLGKIHSDCLVLHSTICNACMLTASTLLTMTKFLLLKNII